MTYKRHPALDAGSTYLQKYNKNINVITTNIYVLFIYMQDFKNLRNHKCMNMFLFGEMTAGIS